MTDVEITFHLMYKPSIHSPKIPTTKRYCCFFDNIFIVVSFFATRATHIFENKLIAVDMITKLMLKYQQNKLLMGVYLADSKRGETC